MYEIYRNDSRISIEDKLRYVKLQSNGIYCLCNEPEAHGVVVNNSYICHLEGKPSIPVSDTVTITEINGSALLADAEAALELLGIEPEEVEGDE